MPSPKVSTNRGFKPPDATTAPLTPSETKLSPSDAMPAQVATAEVVDVLDRAAPEVIWIDEDNNLYFKLYPDGSRQFYLLSLGGEEVFSFLTRPPSIGDAISLEKAGTPLQDLGADGFVRLLALTTVDTDFPLAGVLTDQIAQLKNSIPFEPDLSLAAQAMLHGISQIAGESDVEIEQESVGDVAIKSFTLPESGIPVKLRAESISDTSKIVAAMGGSAASNARPFESVALRTARLCVGWGDRSSITSSDVKALKFGPDFMALQKALRFFRAASRPRP